MMRCSRLPVFPLAVMSGLLGLALAASAQDLPRRKPGLWEMQMQAPARPGRPGAAPAMAAMTSQQCVDERTDADMQKRSFAGGGTEGGERPRCELKGSRRTASGWEMDSACAQPGGGTVATHVVISGDMGARYTVETQARFDPPRHGMSEAKMAITATWKGACPADLKPGQVRVVGAAPR